MNQRTYKLSDVVQDSFLRFPLTLLANPKYRGLSLEAKFVYTLLLDRLTLSQKNGWVNREGEVYLIYTREEVAETLNISYKKAISAFKELIGAELLEETRQGRGFPNLLYVLKADLSPQDAAGFSEKFAASETAPAAPETSGNGISRPTESASLEPSNRQVRHVRSADQDVPQRHPNQTEKIQTDRSETDNQSSSRLAEGEKEAQELSGILQRCELEIFPEPVRQMFIGVIERLYYSKELRVGNAVYPKDKVRSYLGLLNGDTLTAALEVIRNNTSPVRNTVAYAASVLFNCIFAQYTDLFVCLPPEYLQGGDRIGPCQRSTDDS